jgi:hypothetical protein
MGIDSRSRVLVSGGAGFIGRGLGDAPTYDLGTGMATVWPEFAPATALAAEAAR